MWGRSGGGSTFVFVKSGLAVDLIRRRQPAPLLSSPREGPRRTALKGTAGVLKVKLMPGHTMLELALTSCE